MQTDVRTHSNEFTGECPESAITRAVKGCRTYMCHRVQKKAGKSGRHVQTNPGTDTRRHAGQAVVAGRDRLDNNGIIEEVLEH
jgi:hypothetical protein